MGAMKTTEKRCSKCSEVRSVGEFSFLNGKPTSHCKLCHNAERRAWRAANRQRVREVTRAWRKAHPESVSKETRKYRENNIDRALKWKYGLKAGEYERMLEAQGGVCAACLKPPVSMRLAVDHDHATGVVRGLLCVCCNSALGMMKDNLDSILNLAGYLEQHQSAAAQKETAA